MGLEISRNENLPSDIDSQYEIYKNQWKDQENYKNSYPTTCNNTTLSKKILKQASQHILDFLKNIQNVRILEPFAGNGVASKIIYDKLKTEINVELKSTDFQDLSEFMNDNSHQVEFNLNAYETIEKYGNDYNVLMMISPPPTEFSRHIDYFSFNKWKNNGEVFIFIGELGASDGSKGMYKYLLETMSFEWKLELRVMLSKKETIMGLVEKELFIFKKIDNNINISIWNSLETISIDGNLTIEQAQNLLKNSYELNILTNYKNYHLLKHYRNKLILKPKITVYFKYGDLSFEETFIDNKYINSNIKREYLK